MSEPDSTNSSQPSRRVRRPGEGTIYQRPDGRWNAALWIGVPPNRRRISTTRNIREDAEEWLELNIQEHATRRKYTVVKRRIRKLHIANESIYFVQAEIGGPVKIGSSNDPERRLAEMQSANPFALRLVHVIEGLGPMAERLLHERFRHLRLHGEWFEYGEELRDYIESENTNL